jgi:hypothetical protein
MSKKKKKLHQRAPVLVLTRRDVDVFRVSRLMTLKIDPQGGCLGLV